MQNLFAFFDVDCRELADGGGYRYRPRVEPIAEKLAPIYRFIRANDYPLVFTTCCSGVMPTAGQCPDALYVPLDAEQSQWVQRLGSYRQIYLAKKAYGSPQINAACRAWDMFQDNANAVRLLRELDIPNWVVFGNGFDLCVGSAVRGILAAGYHVILLTDIRVSSANGTPQSEAETIADLASKGATITTWQDFLAEPIRYARHR